jgi:hypothetical protein
VELHAEHVVALHHGGEGVASRGANRH